MTHRTAIVIPTVKSYAPWLRDLLASLDTLRPIILAYNDPARTIYDAAAVMCGIEMGLEEFFVLPDTCIVKDNSLFDVLFHLHRGRGAFMNPEGKGFLNKYVLTELLSCDLRGLRSIRTKSDCVGVEVHLNAEYIRRFNPAIIDHGFIDNPKREHRHGRENMVIENRYLKKYKGTWNDAMASNPAPYTPKDEP